MPRSIKNIGLGVQTFHADLRRIRAALDRIPPSPSTPADHGSLTGLGDDDHSQYPLITGSETITGAWTFNRTSTSPFIVGAGSSGQIVTGLNADQWDGYEFADYLNQPVRTGDSPTFADLTVDDQGVLEIQYSNSVYGRLSTDSSGNLVVTPNQHVLLDLGDDRLRIQYDGSNYADLHTTSGGNLELIPTGDIVFDPVGNTVVPQTNWDVNLGTYTKQFLSIWAAELWVNKFVAQETIATVGGSIIVAETTELTDDIAPADTTIQVKHNLFTSGDIGLMKGIGKIEFMSIDSSASLSAGSDLTSNYGFETSGGGGADVFASWTEFADGVSTISQDGTIFQAGSYSAKFERTGAGGDPILYQTITVEPDTTYRFQAYMRGDGTYAGSILVRDATNSYSLTEKHSGPTAAAWELTVIYVRIPQDCTQIQFRLYPPGASGGTAWFDEARCRQLIGFSYDVTRNLDGTSANNWYAGDAIVNTGQVGDAFIDIFSFSPIANTPDVEDSYGPAVVGNVRQSSTYNDWVEMFAAGHLRDIYGKSSGTFGFGAGVYGDDYIVITASDGIEIFNNGVQRGLWDTTGNLRVGRSDQRNVYIDSSGILEIRDSSTPRIRLTGSKLTLGTDADTDTTSYIALLASATTHNSESLGAGDVVLGRNYSNYGNVWWDFSSGDLHFRTGTTTHLKLSTSDQLAVIGNDYWQLGSAGLVSRANGVYGWANYGILFTEANDWSTQVGWLLSVHDTSTDDRQVELRIDRATGGNYGAVRMFYDESVPEAYLDLIGFSYIDQNDADLTNVGDVLFDTDTDRNIWGSIAIGARVYKNSATSIPDASTTGITWNAYEFRDPATMWASGASVLIKDAGRYLLTVGVQFEANATGVRQVVIRQDGTPIAAQRVLAASSSLATVLSASGVADCALNDAITVDVYQDSGGNLDLEYASAYTPFLSVMKLA